MLENTYIGCDQLRHRRYAKRLQFSEATDGSKVSNEATVTLVFILAKEYKNTIMARTDSWSIYSITFGLKMAVYAMEVDRHLDGSTNANHACSSVICWRGRLRERWKTCPQNPGAGHGGLKLGTEEASSDRRSGPLYRTALCSCKYR